MDALLVDSVEEELTLYSDILKTHYQVSCCRSRADLFKKYQEIPPPQLILLEASLKDCSGYQLCHEIKSRWPQSLVLFLSTFDEPQDVLKAYDCGADDYLIKPCNKQLLLARLQVLSKLTEQQNQLRTKTEEAETLAFRSLKEISEYGMVLRMVKDAFAVKSIDEIIDSFFNYINEFGLVCSIQLRSPLAQLSMQGKAKLSSPVEEQVFETLKERGRIYKFNGRMIVNYQKVSILIKNLPSDEFESGRYTDLFCLLAELINAKLEDLERADKLKSSKDTITQVCLSINQKLQENNQDDFSQLSNLSTAIEQMERAFDFMDLSDNEEVLFRSLFDTYHSEFESLSDFLDTIKRQLLNMSKALEM